MKSKAVWQLLVVFILVTVSATFCCSTSGAQRAASDPGVLRFDAEWWHQADSNERQGLICGYRDCRQAANAPIVSITDEQAFVSKAVDSQKPKTPAAVTVAIHLAWKTMKSQKIEKGAEVFTGPHGFLDGEWWREFTGPWPSDAATMDRGYLEGYLKCSSAP